MAMEYEYDGLEEYGGRVLWGRIAFFAAALLLMFFLGRCTASGGIPESQVKELQQEIADLSEQNTRLNDQLAAAQANAKNPLAGPSEDTSETESPGTAETETDVSSRTSSGLPPGARTYTVKSGDTLNSIAEEFYGDKGKYNLIVRANNLRGTQLVVGQKLILPPDPDER